MNIQHFFVVAWYETKLLRRKRLFWAFALAALVLIGYLQFLMQGKYYSHPMVCMASCIPFANAYLFNFCQAFIVIFIAADYMYRDRKLNTRDMILIRPVSNMTYHAGKATSVIFLCILLNLLSISAAIIINLFYSPAPFDLFQYLFYFLTLTLPSLLFMTGLVLCINRLVKITFFPVVLLLAYLFVSIRYLSDIHHGMFDFMAMKVPSVFSGITGHIALPSYLTQRLAYVLAGIGLFLLSVYLSKRFPNYILNKRRAGVFAGFFLILAISCGWGYRYAFTRNDTKRHVYADIFKKYENEKRGTTKVHDIVICVQPEGYSANSRITITNTTSDTLSRLYLFLNPALSISKMNEGEKDIFYQRDGQAVVIERPLFPGEETTLDMEYAGKIDEAVCYTDIPDGQYYENQWSNSVLSYGRRFAFFGNKFMLLTPECLWYPTSLPPVKFHSPYTAEKEFTNYSLKVIHPANRLTLSQGEAYRLEGETIFENSQGLPGLTLCLGDYEQKKIQVDGVSFELYYLKGNTVLASYFEASSEGLNLGVRKVKEDFEYYFGKAYPFRKLMLVEVPVSFTSYRRDWKGDNEYVQPEMILIPENLAKSYLSLTPQEEIRWQRKGVPDKEVAEIESDNIARNCHDLTGENVIVYGGNYFLGVLARHNFFISTFMARQTDNPAHVAPLFTGYSNFFYNPHFPAINTILRYSRQDNNREMQRDLLFTGMTDRYRAGEYLSSHSLREALNDAEVSHLMPEILRLKGIQLQKHILTRISLDRWQEILQEIESRYLFNRINYQLVVVAVDSLFGIDLAGLTEQVYESESLPVFEVAGISQWKVSSSENQWIVSCKVRNTGRYDGVITILSQDVQYNANGENLLGHFLIKAGEHKEIRIPVNSPKSEIQVNTAPSDNIPMNFVATFRSKLKETSATRVGCFDIDSTVFLPDPLAIIVDNEDAGFHIEEPDLGGKLRLQSSRGKDYRNVEDILLSPPRWIASVNVKAYGKRIRSFQVKSVKEGTSRIEWHAILPGAGKYALYVYNVGLGERLQGQFPVVSYHYTLLQEKSDSDITLSTFINGEVQILTEDHTGRSEEIKLPRGQNEGWIPLGYFDLQKGPVKMILHEKGAFPNQLLFADAVKWVRVQD